MRSFIRLVHFHASSILSVFCFFCERKTLFEMLERLVSHPYFANCIVELQKKTSQSPLSWCVQAWDYSMAYFLNKTTYLCTPEGISNIHSFSGYWGIKILSCCCLQKYNKCLAVISCTFLFRKFKIQASFLAQKMKIRTVRGYYLTFKVEEIPYTPLLCHILHMKLAFFFHSFMDIE